MPACAGAIARVHADSLARLAAREPDSERLHGAPGAGPQSPSQGCRATHPERGCDSRTRGRRPVPPRQRARNPRLSGLGRKGTTPPCRGRGASSVSIFGPHVQRRSRNQPLQLRREVRGPHNARKDRFPNGGVERCGRRDQVRPDDLILGPAVAKEDPWNDQHGPRLVVAEPNRTRGDSLDGQPLRAPQPNRRLRLRCLRRPAREQGDHVNGTPSLGRPDEERVDAGHDRIVPRVRDFAPTAGRRDGPAGPAFRSGEYGGTQRDEHAQTDRPTIPLHASMVTQPAARMLTRPCGSPPPRKPGIGACRYFPGAAGSLSSLTKAAMRLTESGLGSAGS